MFGGTGGLMEFRSGLLASRGFAALALAYFAYEDLPRTLDQLDLEYFEEAAELLLRHPKVSLASGDIPGTSWVLGCAGEQRWLGDWGHPSERDVLVSGMSW